MINELLFWRSILTRDISKCVIFITNLCNSKCKTCNIWKSKKKENIDLENIDKILKDLNKRTRINITGGEPLLHPKIEEILKKLKGYNYALNTNGILAKKLIGLVKKHNIKQIVISCDGVGIRYETVRGINNFSKIQKIIKQLKNKTSIILNYTLSPFNSKKDLEEVINFCNKEKVKLLLGVYDKPDFLQTKKKHKKLYNLTKIKTKSNCLILPKFLFNEYISLYNKWVKKEFKVPCLNIRNRTTVYPNGDVCLCQSKYVKLGNINKADLLEIWNSKKTINLQKKYRNCNGCFMNCHKPLDIILDKLKLNKLIR